MRAKAISCERLMETGARVAAFLKNERLEGLAQAEIAYFPDHGIFGGEVVLDRVADMNIGHIAELSTKIANSVIAPAFAVEAAVAIKDRHLIFGGELAPDLIIGR